MTETTNSGPSDVGGATAPTGGIEGGQSMLDGGAFEDDGSGLTPPLGTADADAASEGAGSSLGEALAHPDRGVAGESDALAPQDTQDPSTLSGGRGEGAF